MTHKNATVQQKVIVEQGGGGEGVGQDHAHYEALTKIFLLNIIILSVESNKSHNNDCLMITATVDVKVMTTTHCHHCNSNYSITTAL